MNRRFGILHTGARIAVLVVAAAVLGGCATYHQPRYPDSGVYYGASGGYGHSAGYSRGGYYGPLNPVVYPYWSLDHFYFSQYYHPYSFYVGYHEPLYYPFPGWALGGYRSLHPRYAGAFGFGYPWHGFGYRYPAYTFGFFASYSNFHRGGFGHRDRRDHYRIRDIDQRLQALQRGDPQVSRRSLLARDNVIRGGSGEWQDNRRTPRLQSQGQPRLERQSLRQSQQSRAGLLQGRDARPGASRSTARERVGELRERRRVPDRNEIRRGADRRSAADGHRGIPIENLRGRVILNSRSRAGGEAAASNRSGTRIIRRAPAVDWGRGESASRTRSAEPSMNTRSRVLNRADGGGPPPATRSRPIPSQAPPPRAERIDPPSRAASTPRPSSRSSSAPSRRDLMRKRDNGR